MSTDFIMRVCLRENGNKIIAAFGPNAAKRGCLRQAFANFLFVDTRFTQTTGFRAVREVR
jgi:hypothetical protein